MSPSDNVRQKVKKWHSKLIELNRRNSLYSLPASNRGVFQFLQLPADQIFDHLNTTRRDIRFMLELKGGDEADAPPKRSASSIVIQLPDEQLKRIDRLRINSAFTFREQGIVTLYLAFGVLQWLDAERKNDNEPVRSPLVLMPVQLTRSPADDTIVLSRLEDGLELNPTLVHRMGLADLKISLPALPENSKLSLKQYLESVRAAVAGKRNFAVLDDVYLGRFSFLKMAMYRDLQENFDTACDHPIVAALGGDGLAITRLPLVSMVPLVELDSEMAGYASNCVLDADPTQQRAILAARNGQSFILQGPPGTGKTQTITNIISECMAAGRRVLFVSQKMAALEAVFKRLTDKGLSDFCLELHSYKADKKKVVAQLKTAYDAMRGSAIAEDTDSQQLDEVRLRLGNIVFALHQVRQPLGKSVYEVNGLLATMQDIPDVPFVFVGAAAVDRSRYTEMMTLARRLAKHHALYCDHGVHPWDGVKALRFSLDLRSQIASLLEALLEQVLGIIQAVRVITDLCDMDEAGTLSDCQYLLNIARILAVSPRPPRSWLTDGHLIQLRADAAAQQSEQAEYLTARSQLLQSWSIEVLQLDHDELLEVLTSRYEAELKPLFGRAWQDAVPVRLANLKVAMADFEQHAESCSRTLQLLNERLGLDLSPTLSDEDYLRGLCASICTAKRPLPGWFTAHGLQVAQRLAVAAQSECERVTVNAAALGEWYEPSVFDLDAEVLVKRFEHDYASPKKWLTRQFYRDRRAIYGCVRPAVKRPLSHLTGDLKLLLARQSGLKWLRENDDQLRNSFGSYYNGVDTDWRQIEACLGDQVSLLQQLPNGQATSEIVGMMSGGGPKLREFTDIFEQYCTVLDKQNKSLDAVTLQVALDVLPFTNLPRRQAHLPELITFLQTIVVSATLYTRAYLQCGGCSLVKEVSHASDFVTMLQAAADSVATERLFLAAADDLHNKFSHLYQGVDTHWDTILTGLDWAQQLCEACGSNPPAGGIVDVAVTADSQVLSSLLEAATQLEERSAHFADLCDKLDGYFPLASIAGQAASVHHVNLQEIQLWLEDHLNRLSELESWIDFKNLESDCAHMGMTSFYESVLSHKPDGPQIAAIFEKRFHQLWYDDVLAAEPILRQFRGENHVELIQQFRDLDLEQIETAPGRIRQSITQRASTTDAQFGEAATLKRVISAKRHGSIRKILTEIPNALFQYKPCVLMSPLSVSQYLDARVIQFDLVIFDEASQIFVEDALCSLFRARQVIISGDTKQLPPTDFFLSLSDEEQDEETAVYDVYESILQAASGLARNIQPQKDERGVLREAGHFAEHELLWHYRSRHESLIAFSRQHFYEKIIAFPAPTSQSAVSWRYVADGVYYRGDRKRINPIEAQVIVEEVISAAKENPSASIGVITFNEPQRNHILQLIEERTAKDPLLAKRLDESGSEGFFVKNIENVQGDERDIVLLGLGFGPDETGKLSMNFGPVNREGGERRLNVAVTRARMRMTMVSSITPDRIALKSTGSDGSTAGSKGLLLLRSYLEYAQSGGQSLQTAVPTSSQFETAVAEAIENIGYEVKQNVGVYGYTVNLGVVHPDKPGEFLLGVECDGPTYRDAETVRSRDRLREEVLVKLGWNLHRVWSCDWVNNPAREVARITRAIQDSLNPPKHDSQLLPRRKPPVLSSSTDFLASNGRQQSEQNGVADGVMTGDVQPPSMLRAGGQLAGTTFFEQKTISVDWPKERLYDTGAKGRQQVMELVLQLLELNGPMLERKIVSLAARCVGIDRIGIRVEAALQRAISALVLANRIERRDKFVYPVGIVNYPARVPSPTGNPRPVSEICIEELGEIVLAILRAAIGVRTEDLIIDTARTLGFLSTSAATRERIEKAIANLELCGKISTLGGQIRAI